MLRHSGSRASHHAGPLTSGPCDRPWGCNSSEKVDTKVTDFLKHYAQMACYLCKCRYS